MWTFNSELFDTIPEYYSKVIGFVYLITNLENQKKYIGRKGFYTSKTKQVKGKKIKSKVESDWRTYNSSSEELKKLISESPESFKKEMIAICFSKGTLNYIESKLIFKLNCLESSEWYNGWISARCSASHLKDLSKVIWNNSLTIKI